MLLNGCCFLTSFFQHFIPAVFLSPATLINPPASLLQVWQVPPLLLWLLSPLTDPLCLILLSSFIVIKSHAVSPWQECEICQGRAIRAPTDWYRPGEQQSKLRPDLRQSSVQLLAKCPNCGQAWCDWWSVAPSYRHGAKFKERRIECFFSCGSLLNPGCDAKEFIHLISRLEK